MRILYLDTFSGISGDMVLGLLVDLGVPLEAIVAELSGLPVSGYRLEAARQSRRGIAGTKVTVTVEEQHHHRTWTDIDAMLVASSLKTGPREVARRIFRRIGVAEAAVHGVPLEAVHFHEVGAVDSIVDIVGAAVGLDLLGAGRIVCAPLPLSHGTVSCAHGVYPLPAPATLEILKGLPVVSGQSDQELVTPTGAAIAAEIADFAPLPNLTLERVGYGVGSRDLPDRPNLLRGILGRAAASAGLERDTVTVLETHLDDSTPEALGYLMERLLSEGALDVAFSPLQMKKNRPGVRLTAVTEPKDTDRLARLILHQSSAIGLRTSTCQRLKLRREAGTVQTELGQVQVKLLFDGATLLRIAPECESCRALASASGRPLPEVMRSAERAAEEKYR
ncbi:MAG TPA: nickel pincer cofactor biosynthesis protein LarC [Deferrimonas sp.]